MQQPAMTSNAARNNPFELLVALDVSGRFSIAINYIYDKEGEEKSRERERERSVCNDPQATLLARSSMTTVRIWP
jgi:hypothetical protein